MAKDREANDREPQNRQQHLDGPVRPNARDQLARAQAAAAPKIAEFQAKAGPAAEKAAAGAGKLLGTLRDRARTTMKEFTDALGNDEAKPADGSAADGSTAAAQQTRPAADAQSTAQPAERPADRPRPRPRPHSD